MAEGRQGGREITQSSYLLLIRFPQFFCRNSSTPWKINMESWRLEDDFPLQITVIVRSQPLKFPGSMCHEPDILHLSFTKCNFHGSREKHTAKTHPQNTTIKGDFHSINSINCWEFCFWCMFTGIFGETSDFRIGISSEKKWKQLQLGGNWAPRKPKVSFSNIYDGIP